MYERPSPMSVRRSKAILQQSAPSQTDARKIFDAGYEPSYRTCTTPRFLMTTG
jgi:hypothetical protein